MSPVEKGRNGKLTGNVLRLEAQGSSAEISEASVIAIGKSDSQA